MKLVRYPFEQQLLYVNEHNVQWLKEQMEALLESNKEHTKKADYLGLSLLSLDNAIANLNEEISELKALQSKLKEAKEIALEVGAKVFMKYGITRLEGTAISSLTLAKSVEKTKHRFIIKDEERLKKAGFTKTILDIDAIKEAYETNQYCGLIEVCCEVVSDTTPSTTKLKINKRKSKYSNEYLEEAA